MLRKGFLFVTACLLGACGSDHDTPEADSATLLDAPSRTALDPVDRLVRTSMALRGIRPSIDEIDAVIADPTAIDAYIDAFLETDGFLEQIRHLHAETFLIATDTEMQLPAMGALRRYNFHDIDASQTLEPLKLVEYIVANNLPYTEIVTADYMLTNDVVAKMYGLAYDRRSDEEWQLSEWSDDRPRAGLLSSAKIFRRYPSNGSNFHRARANMVAAKFLCDDFDSRDILVQGGVDISDEFAVAEAASTVTECIGCHQALDPLAGFFWGYMDILDLGGVKVAEKANCASFDFSNGKDPKHGYNQTTEFMCYPIRQYASYLEDSWQDWGLPEPAYYGTPARDFADVGALIAQDSRFAECAARRFFGFFNQMDYREVPADITLELQNTFVESGFDTKVLTRAVVTNDAFLSVATNEPQSGNPLISIKSNRPETTASAIEDLTGYRWIAVGDKPSCAVSDQGNKCWGDVDLAVSDVFGFRAMAGGIDSVNVTRPTFTATPVRMAVMQRLTSNAAMFVVSNDFAIDNPSEARLLDRVTEDTVAEPAVRKQLAVLHKRILAEDLPTDDEQIDLSYELWANTLEDYDGDTHAAWTVTLSALLQDVRFLFY